MPIEIEGYKVFGFVDHDYEVLKKLTIEGRIKYFKYRYDKILFQPLEDIEEIVKEGKGKGRLENEHTSIYMIVMLAILVGIDTFGGFYYGREGDNDKITFKSFVDEYLDQENEYSKNLYDGKNKFSDLLWYLFRCGLAHNLTIKKVGFGYGDDYFRRENNAYYVSVNKLFEDLKQGSENYIQDVKNNKNNLQDKFSKRFKYVFIKGE